MDINNYNKIYNTNLNKLDKKSLQYTYTKKKYNFILDEVDNNKKILEIWPWNCDFLINYVLPKSNISNIYLADISKWIIDNARSLNIFKNENIIFWDFLEVNRKFDIIIFRHVFEHFSKEYTEKVVSNLWNLLTDNWIVFIEVPNWFNFFYWITSLSIDFTHQQNHSEKTIEQCFNLFYKKDFTIEFKWYEPFPQKLSIKSVFWFTLRKFFSFLFYCISNVYTNVNVTNDFLFCKIKNK